MRTGRPWRTRAHRHKQVEAKDRTDRALPLRHAIALGLLHGPTELLPVSSSGHTTLVPWLARWRYAELDPSQRKSFEVALHAGTAAALLLRGPTSDRPRPDRSRRPSFLLAAVVPPALTGYLLGEQIERRLGTPATIAVGLLVGSAAMLSAEIHARNPSTHAIHTSATDTHTSPGDARRANLRSSASAGSRDGLALGIAQALALMPGVSRSGASLAAARARGFSRLDADLLSWTSGLPVIAGAALLQGTRLIHTGAPPELRAPLVAGAGASLLSTLLSVKLLNAERRAALLPACTAYRGALALLAIRRVRDNTNQLPRSY